MKVLRWFFFAIFNLLIQMLTRRYCGQMSSWLLQLPICMSAACCLPFLHELLWIIPTSAFSERELTFSSLGAECKMIVILYPTNKTDILLSTLLQGNLFERLNPEIINLLCRYIGISCVSTEPTEKSMRHKKRKALQETIPSYLQTKYGTRLVKSVH